MFLSPYNSGPQPQKTVSTNAWHAGAGHRFKLWVLVELWRALSCSLWCYLHVSSRLWPARFSLGWSQMLELCPRGGAVWRRAGEVVSRVSFAAKPSELQTTAVVAFNRGSVADVNAARATLVSRQAPAGCSNWADWGFSIQEKHSFSQTGNYLPSRNKL